MGGQLHGKDFCGDCFPVLRGHFRTINADFPREVAASEKAEMMAFPAKWREKMSRLLEPNMNAKARAAA